MTLPPSPAPDDETAFLAELVKTARQRIHVVPWVDRDGSARQTALTGAEASRLNAIAQRRGVSKAELLRQAAHIPVGKPRAAAEDTSR